MLTFIFWKKSSALRIFQTIPKGKERSSSKPPMVFIRPAIMWWLPYPLGWLQQNKASFVPPIPQKLSEAIDSITYSKLETVLFRFPEGLGWEGNQDGMGTPNRFASETLVTTPEYASQMNPGHWNQEIFSFSALPPEVAHPTLLFYI